jgi:tetratricopeptide (TPR) repeat protein
MLTAVLVVAGGCGGEYKTEKQAVKDQWDLSRAMVLHSVAAEQLRVGQLDTAHSKTLETLNLAPEFYPAHVLLAKIFIEQGKFADAATVLGTVCEKLPQSAEPAYLLGVAQEKMRQHEAALDSYRRAYTLDNNRLDAVNAAAVVLLLTDRVDEAKALVDGSLDRAGTVPDLYETAGRIAMIQHNYAAAARYFQDAHDVDFNNLRYRELLGEAQFLAADYPHAIETFTHLLAIKDYTASAITYRLLGDSYMALNRHVDARNAYAKATDVNPNSAGAWANLAQASLMLGDNERATRSARAALSIEHDHADATLVLGYVMFRTGKHTEAVNLLTRAARQHDQNAQLFLVLGRSRQALGHTEHAKECYRKALSIEPGNPLARELLRAIQESETATIAMQ